MWGPWGLFDGVDEETLVEVVMMSITIITMQCGIFGHGYGCGC